MIVYCVIRCVLGWICVIGFQYKNRKDWENIWKIELIFWKWKILETCIGHRTQTCKSFLWNIGLSQNNLGLTQKNVLFPSNRGSLRKNSGLEVEIFSSLNTREYCRVEDIIFIIFLSIRVPVMAYMKQRCDVVCLIVSFATVSCGACEVA